MKKLHYTITTLEPLIITQHSDDPNMYETLQYIRGTVIQGIFAQKYLKNNIADSIFTRLIVSGDCIFLNAFPVENGKTFIPAPIALVREKYNPEKVHNLLARTDVSTEQTKGISSLIFIESDKVSPLTIRKEIRLHNEIDDKKRTTKEGILFNYQSLPAGMVFKGAITLKNDIDEIQILKIIPTGTEIRMGRSATAEYGKVSFEWILIDDNEKLSETGNIIMTLLSDTIIYNKDGFSSLVASDINEYLIDSKVEQSISRKSRIEGFLNVWKLRKPSETVFAAGSSFLLDKLPANSVELINFGLGERTHEGYGQISFSLLNTSINNLEYHEWDEPKLSKPSEIPNLSNKIWISICLKRAKEEVIKKALEDADNTKPVITSNHLLGRLKDMAYSPVLFKGFLTNLRPTAKNHLTNAYLREKNLVEHFETILDGRISLYTPKEGIEIKPQNMEEFKSLYFEQYFNQLRRKNKKNEENGKR